MGWKSPESKAAYDAHRYFLKRSQQMEKERFDQLSPSPELCQIFNIPYGPLKKLKAKKKQS
jgi:hypothetical protein